MIQPMKRSTESVSVHTGLSCAKKNRDASIVAWTKLRKGRNPE